MTERRDPTRVASSKGMNRQTSPRTSKDVGGSRRLMGSSQMWKDPQSHADQQEIGGAEKGKPFDVLNTSPNTKT